MISCDKGRQDLTHPGHEARRIARRAGLSKRCAIFGDCECPGVYLILHRNFVEKGQDTLGYTVTWDDRFFEVEEKKAKVAAYALRELNKNKCDTVSTVVEGREVVLSLVAGIQDEARLKKVQEGGQRDEAVESAPPKEVESTPPNEDDTLRKMPDISENLAKPAPKKPLTGAPKRTKKYTIKTPLEGAFTVIVKTYGWFAALF